MSNDRQLVVYSPRKKISSVRALDFFMGAVCLFAAFICVYFFYLSLTQTLASNLEPVGTVSIRYNSVQRRMDERVLWDRIFNESPLYPGDIIRIAEYSGAVLHFDSNDIELDENTLIRVTVGSLGQPQIILDSGTLNLISAQDSGSINLVVGGNIVQAGQGTVLSVTAADEGMVLKVSDGSAIFVDVTRQTLAIAAGTVITQDETGVEIDHTTDIVPVRPQWMETERALQIINQVAGISEPRVREQGAEIIAVPPPPPPPAPPPPRPTNPPPPPPTPPRPPQPPPPPPPLAAPVLRQPAAGYRLGPAQVRALGRIDFSWSAVNGANAYIVTLFHQTAGGRRQIFRTAPLTVTGWSLNDYSLLDRGTFIWQVEAVNRNAAGVIQRRGNPGESSFVVDVPIPEVRLYGDTEGLYGSE